MNEARNYAIIDLRSKGLQPRQIVAELSRSYPGINKNIVIGVYNKIGMCVPAAKLDRQAVYRRGQECSWAKLSETSVRWIRQHHVPGSLTHGVKALARAFEVNDRTIGDIVAGRTWSHLE